MKDNKYPTKSTPARFALAMLLGCLCFAGLMGQSAAQVTNLPDIQLQRFRPAPGPADYLNVYGTGVLSHLDWTASFYMDFADSPLQLSSRNERFSKTVDIQSALSLLGSVGFSDRLELGLLLPLTVLQTSQELSPILPPDAGSSKDLARTGVNDWRVSAKLQILNPLEEVMGLAVVGTVYLPIATQSTLTSDNGVGGELLAAADYWLWRGIRVGANLGYRYRAINQTFRDSTIGDEFIWGTAVNVPLFMRNLDAILELDGAVSLASKGGRSSLREGEVPLEVKLAGRYRLNEGWSLTAGGGAGLTPGVGTPDYRVFLGIGGYWVYGGKWSMEYKSPAFYGSQMRCPDGSQRLEDGSCPPLDSDGDGVPDSVDRCPGTPPGTRVGTDGCPTFDEDFDKNIEGEGLVDINPHCPDKPADYNGPMDKNGCPLPPPEPPTPQKVVVTKEKIVIIDKVHFETAKATIRPESFGILDEVSAVLQDNPQIKLLRIEGHTDSRGRPAFNQKLSQDRAESVRQYLIRQGVAPARLTAVGYGMDQPIADNNTAEGRAENRRVEFTILENASTVDE